MVYVGYFRQDPLNAVCLLFWTVWCMYSRLQLALSYNQVTTNIHCGFLSTTDSLAVDISSRFR